MSERFRGRAAVRWATIGLVVFLFLAAFALDLYPTVIANVERVQAAKALAVRAQDPNAGEIAWDAGWRSLCNDATSKTPELIPSSSQSLSFIALSSIDLGDYAAALVQFRALAARDSAAEMPNASAYLAALEMDWGEAARSYQAQPTARHRRFWGTIFYLAAQQAMFSGDMEQAAAMYRLADAGYGAQGPYGGLALVECLIQRGRPLEAYDAYRRALATMPPDEALAHLPRFAQLRLEGLRAWHEKDASNRQVRHWLDFYEADAADRRAMTETLRSAPTPQVVLDVKIGEERSLVGFDFREEDIETGPYMQVTFYVRQDQDPAAQYTRIRRSVLNQAPNGAFLWDTVPTGVRPLGWHQFLYSPNAKGLDPQEVVPGERWLCLDAGLAGDSFGLQSSPAPLRAERDTYIQGGSVYLVGDGDISIARTWLGTQDPHNYSPVGGRPQAGAIQALVGSWIPPVGADQVAAWIVSHRTTRACFDKLYLFAVPF